MPPYRLYAANCPAPPPRRPCVPAAPRPIEAPAAAAPAAPESAPTSVLPAVPPSENIKEHLERAERWIDKQQLFDQQDARAIHHREHLDARTAMLRTRFEGLHHELVEMVAEYNALQEADDAHEEQRWAEHEALCADADAVDATRPLAPRSVALHYDTSLPLRDVHAKLEHKVHLQRGDRSPDWLKTLTAVVGTAVTAWAELARGREATDEDASWRPAVDAVKAVGLAVRAKWKGQYNLCAHADGTVETTITDVVGGGVGFSYADKYGDAWRMHLARNAESEDARSPLTGPRVDGRLNFEETQPAELPHEYTDQHRELALDAVAVGWITQEEVEAAVDEHGAAYADAIRLRWVRERPNTPLTSQRLGEMVARRATRELAKAWRDPDLELVSDYASSEEAEEAELISAPMEDAVVAVAVAEEPKAPPSPVSSLTNEFYNMTQFQPPWYAR